MPVFNGEVFVAQSLDSILAQTFTDYELLISDNASTDSTPEICRSYAARDSRIRYLRNDVNIGPNRNFNLLVQRARGTYFKLANADDLCAPEFLARCVEVLDREPEVVLCYERTRLIDAEGRVLGDYDDNLDLRSASAVKRFLGAVQQVRMVNVLQGVVRLDELRKTGLLAPRPDSDVLLVVELALRGQFHELPDRLFFRRLHPAAASAIKSPEERGAFVDPLARSTRPLRTWRKHLGYAAVILRTPLSLGDRATLLYLTLRFAVWDRSALHSELLNLVRSSMRGSRT
jgi:glycosyltransferase involved in cell wall biosynthesis